MRRTSRRKAEPSATPPPPLPPIDPVTARSTPFPPPPPRSPRFALPLILAVSASVLAISAYQYGKHSAAPTVSPASTRSLPPLSTTTPSGSASAATLYPASQLPVLLSHTPSATTASLASHPVLRHVAPFGLPALPYNSKEGKYAYPLLVREGYVCQWNVRTRNADWVMEVLNGSQPASTPPPLPRAASSPAAPLPPTASPPASPTAATRDLSTFRSDPLLSPVSLPPTPSLYLNSSYDRGHLVPAASAASASQSAMDETFYLTNISPQHPNCNRGYWRAIEGWLRETARQWRSTHGPSASLTVVTGPLWLEEGSPSADAGGDSKDSSRRYVRYEVIPRSAPLVAVPTHFFKLLLATREGARPLLAAFVVPNGPISATVPLQSFVTSVAAIESNSGWHFFPLLPRASTTTAATAKPIADKPANVIDVAELLLGEAGEGGVGRGRGLSELERASVFELCRDGGCDLGAQWRKIEQWDAVNHDKRRRGRRSSSAHVPLSTDGTSRGEDGSGSSSTTVNKSASGSNSDN